MYSDLHWNIYPQADVAARASVAAYLRHCAEHGIEDGPAMDAGRDGLPIRVDEGVAIIPLMGPMMRRAGPIAARYGIAGTDGVRLAIESAAADDDVDQILLRIDSPGGSVSGLDQLGDTIAAATKPVTALVDGMAASAAYYVASQADRIMLGRNDLVGSIGTRMMLYDFSRQFENDGVEAVPIDTGKHKSAGALGTKITDEQRAEFQRIVDFYFADFVRAVAGGRGMSADDVRKIADGRMFTPDEAVGLGLADGVSTYAATLNELRAKRAQRTSTLRERMKI